MFGHITPCILILTLTTELHCFTPLHMFPPTGEASFHLSPSKLVFILQSPDRESPAPCPGPRCCPDRLDRSVVRSTCVLSAYLFTRGFHDHLLYRAMSSLRPENPSLVFLSPGRAYDRDGNQTGRSELAKETEPAEEEKEQARNEDRSLGKRGFQGGKRHQGEPGV